MTYTRAETEAYAPAVAFAAALDDVVSVET